MPRLSIPERFRTSIATLGLLPETEFKYLLSAIQQGTVADTPEAFAKKLKPGVPSLTQNDLSSLVEALAALQTIFNSSHVSGETFATDVSEGLATDAPQLTENISLKKLRARVLRSTVKSKGITITSAKIRQLRAEVERSFCRVRILTDIRAAFSEDAAESPSGMTILHTLQIGYHDDTGTHKEFYVALDATDLSRLKEAVQRAEKKKKKLQEMLTKGNFRVFE